MAAADRIKELEQAALDIARIKDPEKRHRGGYWLNEELTKLDDSTYLLPDEWIDFCAIIKVMFDLIFFDAREGGSSVAGSLD